LSMPFRSLSIVILILGVGPVCIGQSPERISRVARDGYGFADRTQKYGFDEHTRFNIGSISKQFTAAAILLLQDEGKLKTSDRVLQLLQEDELPQAWSEITVRELLSHTQA
jgi:CubicO group peptidase (beta-lactamase class C family)